MDINIINNVFICLTDVWVKRFLKFCIKSEIYIICIKRVDLFCCNPMTFQPESSCCPCCLDPIDLSRTSLSLINCKHSFHASCINKWLDQAKNTCPMCRALIMPMTEAQVPPPTPIDIASFEFDDLVEIDGIHKTWRFHGIEYAVEIHRIISTPIYRDELVAMCHEAAAAGSSSRNVIRIRTRLDLGGGYIHIFKPDSIELEFDDLRDKLRPYATAYHIVSAVKAVNAANAANAAGTLIPRSAYRSHLSCIARDALHRSLNCIDVLAAVDSDICFHIVDQMDQGVRLDQILMMSA